MTVPLHRSRTGTIIKDQNKDATVHVFSRCLYSIPVSEALFRTQYLAEIYLSRLLVSISVRAYHFSIAVTGTPSPNSVVIIT